MSILRLLLSICATIAGTLLLNAQTPDIKMVLVKGGTFNMGCDEHNGDCKADEKPVHQVTLSDFYIGKYEVTQSEWNAVMGTNPSNYTVAPSTWRNMKILMDGVNELNKTHYAIPTQEEWRRASVIDNLPVEQVSWDDIQVFIHRLNEKTGMNYRLPTEAEWEYAARGGQASKGYKYSGGNTVGEVAWYGNNSGSKTHMVGTKRPNELGIHDMSGNVSEFTGDWYYNYTSTPRTNPKNNITGVDVIVRGGAWNTGASIVRIPVRLRVPPNIREPHLGFRLARSVK
jgi:formylglycine-generating enzyme required for sulfatase activity